MLSEIQRLLKPPAFADEEQTRVAGLLHVVSLALLAALALTAVAGVLFGHSRAAQALAIGLLGPLASLWLTRRGRLRTAGLTALLAILGLLNYLLYGADGLHDIAVLGYPAVIVIASLLLDKSAFIAYVTLLIVSLQAIIYGEVRGLIVNPLSHHTSPTDFVYAAVIMGVTAIGARLLADSITRNIARVRASQQALAESNRELTRVNEALTHEITERQRVEEAYRTLVDRSVNGLLIIQEGRITFANPAFAKLSGYTMEELLALSPREIETIIPREDQASVWDYYQGAMTGKRVLDLYECRGLRKDGSIAWVELHASRITYQGAPAIQMMVLDITERKRAEQQRQQLLAQVQEQSQQLQGIMAMVPDGILLLDDEMRVVQANPPAESYLRALIDAQANAPTSAVGTTVTHLGDRCVADLLSFDGGRGEVRSGKGEVGRVKGGHSERASSCHSERSEESRSFDPKRQRPQDDAATLRPLRYHWHEVHSAADRTFEVTVRAMQDKPAASNYVMVLRDGPSVGRRSPDRGPSASNYVMVLRDVTAQRETQAHLQQQDRLAALGQLAAGIAHDFNNILAVIALYTQMNARAIDITTREHERLTIIQQQVDHAKDLILQILDFSRSAVLDRRPLDLLPFLKEQVILLERTLPENILLELHYAVGDYTVNADPTRIQQAITNLALNARDAMPEGGRLDIKLERLRSADRRDMPLPNPDAEDWISITVADTGCGIPQDILPHIFDPFFTTKPPGKGTGLGLSQVWGIVNQHEGYVDVTSDTRGTVFRLYLPAVTSPQSQPDNLDLTYGKGQKILLVEDKFTTRKALAESLEFLNYQVMEAKNGQEALTIYESQPDIALVVSDMIMPRMSGELLFHALQKHSSTVKVILLTGHPMAKELEALIAQGLSGWLLKPVDLGQLAELVAKALEM